MIISTWEQTIIDAIKDDGKSISSIGIAVDTDGDLVGNNPYCTDLPMPVKNFDTLVPSGSLIDKKVSDGLRVAAAPLVRQMAPIGFNFSQTGFGSPRTITTTAAGVMIIGYQAPVSQILQAPRIAMVTAAFTGETQANGTKLDFWIEVNKVPTNHLTYFFDNLNKHESMSGNWLVTLPPGSLAITLMGRTSASTVTLDSNDCASVTILG